MRIHRWAPWWALLSLVLAARANSLVQFRTVLGTIEVELLDQEKPVTVANFKRYVEAGAYRDSFFHRAIHNFVLQGGGYSITNRTTTEYDVIHTFPPITNEFKVGPFRSNVAGTIAMAKSSDPNSATSQFFFNLVDNSASLDNPLNSGGFTVFGLVKGDTNVLTALNSFVRNPLPITNIFTNTAQVVVTNVTPGTNLIYYAGGAFTELPLLSYRTNASGYLRSDSLVYADISLLSVQVSPLPAGGHTISWDSVRGGTNQVEFTTVFPPVWNSLTNRVRPIETRSSVIDTTSTENRFYRVRIAY